MMKDLDTRFPLLFRKLRFQEIAVILMKDVAEAVHAAHQIGLIHRDLKPANVMVETDKNGKLCPFVMDFGLAREVEAPELTRTGMALGTPAYMSPEQASAKRGIDHRTDVWALGATLHDVLTGHPPFEGSSAMEVLRKVVNDDPKPLAKQVPRDLETITLKCLEKEPERRYESAHTFAQDLQRFLDDEPIFARPATITYKLQKKAEKHKTLVVVTAAGLVAVVFLLGWNLHTVLQSRLQARVAAQFGSDAQQIESILRIAYLLPLHDTTEDVQSMREKTKDIEDQMATIGVPAFGPGNYALGRANMALRQPFSAKDHLEKAWNSGYTEPIVAYALGRTYGEIYQIKLDGARRAADKDTRNREIKKAETEFLKPAVEYLTIGRKAKTESAEYVEALLAFYDKKTSYQEDLKKAEAALNHPRWLYETKKLEGDIYRSIGNDLRDGGKMAEATQNYNKARQPYLATVDMARSDAIGYEGLCDLENDVLFFNQEYGKDPKPAFDAAIEDCSKALEVKPDSFLAHDLAAEAYLNYSRYQVDHGEDPGRFLDKLNEHASASLELAPDNYDAYALRAAGYFLKGMEAEYAGEDPRDLINQSIDDYKKSMEHEPDNPNKLVNLGNSYVALVEYQFGSG